MTKPASPFAGIKLSEQTSLASRDVDQRLFSAPPPVVPELRQPKDQGTLEPRNQGSKVARKEGSKEPSRQPSLDTGNQEAPLFDINESPYRNNTFAFTTAELEAVEDLKIALQRKLDLRATKYDIIRCGVHMLIEDYRRNGKASFIVTRIGRKNSR